MQTQIHDAAAKGFQTATDAYERGRPEYPREAIDRLIVELAIEPGSRVADVGAGTGKFTKLLVPTGARLSAIEPVEGMRRKLKALLPEIEILPDSAERITLPNASLDAITIAQAFHWFDGPAALEEFHRVLKPGGRLGLIWNARDESVDWVARLTDVIDPHEKGAPRYKSGAWRAAFETAPFSPLQSAAYRYVQSGPPTMIVDRVASISFIAAMPESERSLVLDQVRELIATHPQTRGLAMIELPYRTDVFWTRRQ